MRILILDGEHRSALAAVRSLARNGHQVFVGSQFKKTISGFSKYCRGSVIYNTPWENGRKFKNEVKAHLSKLRIDALLPMTDATMYRILQYEKEMRKQVLLPAVSFEQYKCASDKCNLMKLADRLRIEYPETQYFSKCADVLQKEDRFKYPIVLKPQSSIIEINDSLIHCSVSIIDSPRKLHNVLTSRNYYQYPFMTQEYINGEGMGVFALCSGGKLKAFCGHKRIREKPPWGGVSVVSESVVPHHSLVENASTLLKELKWEGVAMVEFKNDKLDKKPKLMEINARFWGSLQLSIDAGIDFPNLLFSLLDNKEIGEQNKICYTRHRWLMGDLDNLIINLKTGNIATKIEAIKAFIKEFITGSKIEDYRYNDFKPFLLEIIQSVFPANLR